MDRPIRVLLSWLDHNEAVAFQLGHLPQPEDDIRPMEQRWEEHKANLASRAALTTRESPILPIPTAFEELARNFRNRPDVQTIFTGLDWTPAYANLTKVLSFQKIVVLEGIDERISAVSVNDPASLFAFCLPEPATPTPMSAALDQDQKGMTFSSLNPNLRVSQLALQGNYVGFQVILSPSFLQVVEYRDRWFIRDGYHRTYALLRAGREEVPCILVRARNFQETGANAPGFFSYEILYGEGPPYVKDFLDNSVSVQASQRAMRKVVRLRAEEFNVEI